MVFLNLKLFKVNIYEVLGILLQASDGFRAFIPCLFCLLAHIAVVFVDAYLAVAVWVFGNACSDYWAGYFTTHTRKLYGSQGSSNPSFLFYWRVKSFLERINMMWIHTTHCCGLYRLQLPFDVHFTKHDVIFFFPSLCPWSTLQGLSNGGKLRASECILNYILPLLHS